MVLPQKNLTPQSQPQGAIPIGGRRLVQEHKSSARWLQIILDLILVVTLLYVHTWIKGTPFDTHYQLLAMITVLLMAVVYNMQGVYRFSTSLFERFMTITRAWLIVIGLLVIAGFITKTSSTFSREVVLTWSVTGLGAQLLSFLLVRTLQTRATEERLPTLVGADRLGQHLADHINNNPWIPDYVVGLVSNEELIERKPSDIPVLGDISQLEYLAGEHGIKRIYLALPMHQSELVKPIYLQMADANVDIIWAPDIFSVDLMNHSIRELGGVPLISLSETPLIGSNAFMKSLLDFSIASTALLILSPLMLATAAAIKLTSKGPVFFSQKRHGWDGKVITIYKFRSMRLHEETPGHVTQAKKDDDRITTIGRIIRRTSIDELPQLFNVLNGSMSIVGPRPHALAHDHFYGSKIKDYMRRHRVKPGLTGLAQVNGFRGETEDISKMEARVQHDLAYINNWSVWLDIKIMLRTVFVLMDKNAY